MSLSDRLRRMEEENRQNESRISELEKKVDILLSALEEGDESEEQVDITSLDGERYVGAGARDQAEPL
ncbi:hypothetical protein [Lysobacter enzymogenes]|uniref:hypothetical protein n=1 Tax=Lysobacter enzymogenes TaxID=69 RepID=UPI0008966FD4|nr:hypothetical protein [Lysobacter enzymogenes]SDW94570.1 hypothetical protein SAMN05421681_103300 [Lysobacter enzymogenes]